MQHWSPMTFEGIGSNGWFCLEFSKTFIDRHVSDAGY